MTGSPFRRAAAVVLALGVVLSTVLVATAVAAASASADHGGGTLTLHVESGQTVSGTTSLPSGAEVSVRLQGQDGETFLKSKTTVTDGNGDYRATFDLSDVDPAAAGSVTVSVKHEDATLTTTEAGFAASADDGSSGTAPGLGVLAAVGALVGAAGLARRR